MSTTMKLQCDKNISNDELIKLLHKELYTIIYYRIPTKILFDDGRIEYGVVNEDISINKELERYIRYVKENVIDTRVICPITDIDGIHTFDENMYQDIQDKKIKKIKKAPLFQETNGRKLSLLEIGHLIKGELETMLENEISIHVLYKNSASHCILKKKLNASYETQRYIMFMYNKVNNYDVTSFDRVICPIHNYNLEDILMGLPAMCFLSLFADIKAFV